jgi:hypothetical protein
MKKWKVGRTVDNEGGWMTKGKEEVGYLMMMMDGWKNGWMKKWVHNDDGWMEKWMDEEVGA